MPLRKREEVQEVLRCPRVGMSGQVRPARFAGPSLNTPQPLLDSPAAAGRGMRRSLGRPLTDRAGRRPRSRRGGTRPAIVTECHVSAAGANGKGGAETLRRSGGGREVRGIGGRGRAVGIGTPARRFRGARRPRAGAAHPLGGRFRLDPPGLRSGGRKGDAPGRSACPAAYDARYVADVRRVLPGGAGGGRTRGSQAAAHRTRSRPGPARAPAAGLPHAAGGAGMPGGRDP